MSDIANLQVNATFGEYPQITFSVPDAPAGLYCDEIVEGDGPMVRKGDIVTVNYHGVIWGKDKPFDSSFDRHQPIDFGIGVGQVIKGWDNTVPGHNVGSRLVVSIPPQYGYGSYGVPQAGIGGDDTLVFVIDIISTTSGR
ncbi:FKBP-type peptidyl-prolyl cis-trans isomerase [Alloscardovia venturai]|uniref:Peptidyl-prolyl cis-trans isomerase n=1 Tax=Alloscardovia venturai TaxID=1769421 RepID=A0ABW2Y3J9_9BIFI